MVLEKEHNAHKQCWKITMLDKQKKGLTLGTYYTMKNFLKFFQVACCTFWSYIQNQGWKQREQNTKKPKHQTLRSKTLNIQKIEHHALI
jgi:hypothetical protein